MFLILWHLLTSAIVAFRYKIGNNYRTLTARINVARTNATTATCAGGIFVIGGISKKDYSYLNSVKFHVPASDSWLPVAPMNQRRKHFRVAIFNGELYVFGGCSSHNEMLSSIEKYNYQQNNRMWTEVRHKTLLQNIAMY